MPLLVLGTQIDGFVVAECLHMGSMAHIYRVNYADARPDPGFPMVMKVPRMAAGDGAENIISFEVEEQILRALTGPHVPRLLATGDLDRLPFLVMEYLPGPTLQHWLDTPELPGEAEVARIGAALATAVHSLHQQNTVHLDLKPANVVMGADGRALLLDFGLSCNAHFPDLLAEELRRAVGSPTWIAPEQVVGVRGDLRSDIFAIGVILYQLLTRELPFGEPQTVGGLRQRLWMTPTPPRCHHPELSPWLQEVVLRCLEPQAERRYASAAHLAFDLTHPEQVTVTESGRATQSASAWVHFKRWLRAAGMQYQPSPLPASQIAQVPIVMVALPHYDVSDATLYSLRDATARALGTLPGARLTVVTVIAPGLSNATRHEDSETSVQRRYLIQARLWVQPLDLPGNQTSCHVLESGDVAQALLDYASGNHVSVIVMGASTQGHASQRLLGSVPILVAMDAPCSVILVKQSLPIEQALV